MDSGRARTQRIANKREGDATRRAAAFGCFASGGARTVRRVRDRLPVRRIARDDAWCEDPGDRRYNRPVKLDAAASGDRLWRDDRLYDFIIELDHNTRPRIAGRGSAVFVHVAARACGPPPDA